MNQEEKIHTVEFSSEETDYFDIIDNYDGPPSVTLEIPLSREEYELVESNQDEFRRFCIYQMEEMWDDGVLKRGYFTQSPADYISSKLWEFMENHTN